MMLPFRPWLAGLTIRRMLSNTPKVNKGQNWDKSRKNNTAYSSTNQKKSVTPPGKLSSKKLMQLIRTRYAGKLLDENKKVIHLTGMDLDHLLARHPQSKPLFNSIVDYTKNSHTPEPRIILASLCSLHPLTFSDSYQCSKEVIKLLKLDIEDPRRVTWVIQRTEKDQAIVPMNILMESYLKLNNMDAAWKSLSDRKKWRIPFNNETYISFFHGLAKCYEPGRLPNGVADRAITAFTKYMNDTLLNKKVTGKLDFSEFDIKQSTKLNKSSVSDAKCTIEHFNAALTLLSRNYTNDQEYMWLFFDLLLTTKDNKNSQLLYPDIQTFTILLNGLRKYCEHRAEEVLSQNLSEEEETFKLLDIHARLVSTSQMILKKVIKSATPPVPPKKEDVAEDQELLEEYKRKCSKPLVEIDLQFVSVFLNCISNVKTRTGSTKSHSSIHYRYLEEAFQYLRCWSKHSNEFLKFITTPDEFFGKKLEHRQDTLSVAPTLEILELTDKRINSAVEFSNNKDSIGETFSGAETVTEILPATIIDAVDKKYINPWVIFPPPVTLTRKVKATFSGKQKPLVDLTRMSTKSQKLLKSHENHIRLKGKFGSKVSKRLNLQPPVHDISTFTLQFLINGMLYNGRFDEAYLGVWYGLARWGGVDMKLQDLSEAIAQNNGIGNGLIPEKYTFNLAHDVNPKRIKYGEFVANHDEKVVDTVSVETFMYKFSELLPPTISASMISSEILLVLLNKEVNTNSVEIRPETLFKFLEVVSTELREYQELKPSLPNKPLSLNDQQLYCLLRSMTRFSDCVVSYLTSNDNSNKKKMSLFIGEYNRITNKIVQSIWESIDPLIHHVRVIRSGVRFYRSKKIESYVIHPDDTLSNVSITSSLKFIVDNLRRKETLDDYEKKLLQDAHELLTFEGTWKSFKALNNKVLFSTERYLHFKETGEDRLILPSKFVDKW